MKRESGRFSQQAINKIAEIAIASQLKQDVEISVNIVTTLKQISKGQIDAVAIAIQRLVLSENLKTEEFQLDIGAVTVKPLSAVKGKIKLLHPSEGKLRVVVNENDLTAAVNQAINQQLQRVSSSPNQTALPVFCRLADNRLTARFNSDRLSTDTDTTTDAIELTVVPDSTQGIQWQPLSSPNSFDPELITSLISSLDRLLSLKDFEQKGLFLNIQTIQIADGKLRLDADALIQEFPPE